MCVDCIDGEGVCGYNVLMSLFTGKNLSLAPTVGAVIRRRNVSLLGGVKLLTGLGFEFVQLDLHLSGIRPWELDARGRKDLLGKVGRCGAMISGLDYFQSGDAFLSSDRIDQTMARLIEAIGFARDLGGAELSICLPLEGMSDEISGVIGEAAERYGTRVITHYEGDMARHVAWLKDLGCGFVRGGMDAGACMGFGQKADQAVHLYKALLGGGRLSDGFLNTGGGAGGSDGGSGGGGGGSRGRVCVGEGDLDVRGYRMGLEFSDGFVGPVVLSLNGLDDPLRGGEMGLRQWEAAGAIFGA